MRFGYNTNGLAHHDPVAAIDLLADLGYQSVALTLDVGPLDPFAEDFQRQLDRLAGALAATGMGSVVETGARFLLDPRLKHEPTLLTADEQARGRRIEFLRRAILAADRLGSDCVSLWSGVLRDACDEETAWGRLVAGLREVLDYAGERNVPLGFEPEPGMFVDTMARWEQLLSRLDDPLLMLTLDVGHLHCQGEGPIAEVIRRWGERLVNVHIEDMRRGVHEHLMLGEGEMDFPPILAALHEVDYRGGVHVELSRHSHMGPEAARLAMAKLKRENG